MTKHLPPSKYKYNTTFLSQKENALGFIRELSRKRGIVPYAAAGGKSVIKRLQLEKGSIATVKKSIIVIHGPNINLTGEREASVYGKESFDSINQQILDYAAKLSIQCETYQSNIEGEIINKIHDARNQFDGIVLNAGAYTHYSYAIRDAIAAVHIPCIEVHFSNVFSREDFRSKSVIAPVCAGSISGFGKYSYMLALNGLAQLI